MTSQNFAIEKPCELPERSVAIFGCIEIIGFHDAVRGLLNFWVFWNVCIFRSKNWKCEIIIESDLNCSNSHFLNRENGTGSHDFNASFTENYDLWKFWTYSHSQSQQYWLGQRRRNQSITKTMVDSDTVLFIFSQHCLPGEELLNANILYSSIFKRWLAKRASKTVSSVFLV